MSTKLTKEQLAATGNPSCPEGERGREMLEGMNVHHEDVTLWGLKFFKPKKDSQMLDIGCGGGATLRRLLRRAPRGHVTGIDYSPVSVALSKETNEDLIKSGKVEVVEGSVEALPFADNTFDRIASVESFYFWPNPRESILEVLRVLKPGGQLLIICDTYDNGELTEEQKANIERFSLYCPTMTDYRTMFWQAGYSAVHVHTKPGTAWVCLEAFK